MRIDMDERIDDNNSSILQIKELKEKVRSLVSEVDLHCENAKFKPDIIVDNNLSNSVYSDENEEFLDYSEIESLDETNWLSEEKTTGESLEDICRNVYSDVEDDRPDITALCQQLEASSIRETNIFSSQRASIDSRTFTRPKKFSARPSLTSVVNSGDDGRPKLQRRLTTTISPTPNLISKLEELSKTNNRPVSGNYSDVNWQDGSAEDLAEMGSSSAKSKRRSVPASLFDRLQELKKANSLYKIPKIMESSLSNGKIEEYGRSAIMEDAKKVTAALDTDLKGNHSSSRLSEIFRNTQEYFSDDNESFISLDEVSGFCDRLTLSTDQSTYSSIVKEMEQHEICLFHRTFNDDKSKDPKVTSFGGLEIPSGDLMKNKTMNQSQLAEEENELNRTYEIDEEEELVEKKNGTFEIQKTEKHNIMNLTYDANKKPGLMDVILQSDVIKNLAPSNGFNKKTSMNNNISISSSSSNNNNNINNKNNNRNSSPRKGNNILNSTYNKLNGTLDQNELNALHAEKYSTKIFDSSYRKSSDGSETQRFPTRKSNGKKDSDYSEDDCMSTTSDHSYRSVESNSDARAIEELRNVAVQQNKKFSSTPIMEQRSKLNFEVVSPIRMEVGDGESQVFSNPSSRGQSPRRISAPGGQEGSQKLRMPNIRQPLKVPQRELKLKPALLRPSQNFKRPLSYARTSSEPSVPQKVESCQSTASVPVLRPSGPTGVPSLTNVRPSSRASGIPRPPTRLKQPQIRVNYSKKKIRSKYRDEITKTELERRAIAEESQTLRERVVEIQGKEEPWGGLSF